MRKELLRNLPKVDILLKDEELEIYAKSIDYYTFSSSIKEGIDLMRERILKDEINSYTKDDIILEIKNIIEKKQENNLKKVINGTGTIIHTNLGRSIFDERILKKSFDVLTSYNNLEFDLESGKRGSRYSHIEKLICDILNVEGAIVVNNNAAAVLLCLNEFAKEKEVIVSRGELVEIGGSFRIPEIMKFAGADLKEVGTTNRTYIEDYENSITENSKILLKVHTSNYKIMGFTHEPTRNEIVKLAEERDIISMEDAGSGILIDLSKYNLKKETTIQEIIKSGMDLITFSGDKLLGGPQAGIIVGKKKYIERLKKNQYLRTIRVDKITIAILENIFKLYREEKEALSKIPTLKYITENILEVERRAKLFSTYLKERKVLNKVVNTFGYIGGGSMPEEKIKSYGVEIISSFKPNELQNKLRNMKVPVIGRIEKDKFIIDLKAISEKELNFLADIISKTLLEGNL